MRLIDADAFAVTLKQISEKQGYSELYMNVDDVLNAVIDDLQGNALNGYENCPTVEAIPKADYEARLKADIMAMLEELKEQLREMHEDFFETEHFDEAYGVSDSMDIIQEKIDALRGEEK